ncbi:conserved hypothetical protein [Ricinus communis]|uniref:Uncharacterized protein n=1 Tax=Ricinus communis TaxID=3988 RepID=B9RHZ7_RICCO|nr:conserved hypothetical protein [Ricinus communis]
MTLSSNCNWDSLITLNSVTDACAFQQSYQHPLAGDEDQFYYYSSPLPTSSEAFVRNACSVPEFGVPQVIESKGALESDKRSTERRLSAQSVTARERRKKIT